MTMSLFFLNFLVLAASGGAIYWFTWLLKNYCFSDDEKIQHIAERIIKVARGVIAVLMGFFHFKFSLFSLHRSLNK